MLLNNKNWIQHAFGKIANFVVNSRLYYVRNFMILENYRFRSSAQNFTSNYRITNV